MPPRRLRSRLRAWALPSRAESGRLRGSRATIGRPRHSRARLGRLLHFRATIGRPTDCRARSVRSEAQNWREVAREPLRRPNAARERIGCPNAARQPPRVHALPGNAIGTGAELSQEGTWHKCSCQFWELLFGASANTQTSTQQNPRITRRHHALTSTRSKRYSHYWNERISGVGGARGLPPPRSTYWNLFVENENVIAKPSPSTESAKIPTPILSHNRLTR